MTKMVAEYNDQSTKTAAQFEERVTMLEDENQQLRSASSGVRTYPLPSSESLSEL